MVKSKKINRNKINRNKINRNKINRNKRKLKKTKTKTIRKNNWKKTLSASNKKKLINKYNNTLDNIYKSIQKYIGSPGGPRLIHR